MIKLLSRVTGLSFLLLAANVAHAGIVFDFGSNVNAERQAALEAAKAEIEQIIDFKQDVKISLSFTNLECDASSALLGFAGPVGICVQRFCWRAAKQCLVHARPSCRFWFEYCTKPDSAYRCGVQ
jgi:hypothetical protein